MKIVSIMNKNNTSTAIMLCMISSVYVIGCDARTSQRSVPQVVPANAASLRCDFFDGRKILAPSIWTTVPEPKGGDGANLILRLQIRAIAKGVNETGYFADGTAADPQWDPLKYIQQDFDVIQAMGRALTMDLRWGGKERDKGFAYDMIYPDGIEIQGTSFANYFNIIRKLTEEGRLDEIEREIDLSGSLLCIGFNVYKSDDSAESFIARRIVLGSAWSAAFELRRRQAVIGSGKENGADKESVTVWNTRDANLLTVLNELHSANLDEIGKHYGE